MKNLPMILTMAGALALTDMPALAQEKAADAAADGEWIRLTGSIASATQSGFVLEYGDDDITVEMDDADGSRETVLLKGNRVTVTGRMDSDFDERRTIEASSVYVHALDKVFRASPVDDEEPFQGAAVRDFTADEDWVTMTGTVVRRAEDEFVLDTGPGTMTVDTSNLGYRVLAEPGTRITVMGRMDDADLFRRREVVASSVIVLPQD